MDNDRYPQTKRVTLIGAVIDFVLGVAKITGGMIGHSHGLVADGVHSLSDLVTDALVVWAARKGNEAADLEHPYGHERIETITTVLLGIALIAVALGIAWDAVERLLHPESLGTPEKLTAAIAFVSILSKEWIYRYTLKVARKIDSRLLHANAWHSRSDALSSIVVLVGILGAMAGIKLLDAVAAVIVAAMIIHVGWRLGRDSVQELIDTGLEKTTLEKLRNIMLEVNGVQDVHQLRTRRMGTQVIADVHIMVDSLISVSEGHRISEEVERRLYDSLDNPMDITVHIDCEEDQQHPPALLPMRHELEPELRKAWSTRSELQIDRITLHYLGSWVTAEIQIVVDDNIDVETLRTYERQMRDACAGHEKIGTIHLVATLGHGQ